MVRPEADSPIRLGAVARPLLSRRTQANNSPFFVPALVSALLVIVAWTSPLRATDQPFDAMSIAFGAVDQSDAQALWQNPAALAGDDSAWSLALAASRPFGLADLTTVGFSFARTRPRFGLALGMESFGNDIYRETTVRAAFGYRLGSCSRLGIALEAAELAITGYERTTSVALTGGFLVRPTAKLFASLVGRSLVSWSRGELLLPERRAFSLNADYAATPIVHLTGVVTREVRNRWSSSVGIALEPRSWVSIRLGRTSGPSGFTGGCEIRSRYARFGYGVRFHPDLDPTQAVTVTLVR